MVLNYIWIAFFLVAFAVALVRLVLFGDTEVFPAIMNSTFSSAKSAFEISLGLTGVLSLWLGIMRIGEWSMLWRDGWHPSSRRSSPTSPRGIP